jgi:hypothetical protein
VESVLVPFRFVNFFVLLTVHMLDSLVLLVEQELVLVMGNRPYLRLLSITPQFPGLAMMEQESGLVMATLIPLLGGSQFTMEFSLE